MREHREYILWGTIGAFIGVSLYYWVHRRRRQLNWVDVPVDEAEEDQVSEENEVQIADKDVLVLGLHRSGKSALLDGLNGRGHTVTQPTTGFNVVSLPGVQNSRLNLIELGGEDKTRRYWKHFYKDKALVVFVVDASDANLFVESKELLHELLTEVQLKALPFILVAHKQDMGNAVDSDALLREMDVKSFTKSGQRNIYPVQTQTPPSGTASGTKELKSIISSLLFQSF